MVPTSLVYLEIMLGVIILWFSLLKRPVYEGAFVIFGSAFITTLAAVGVDPILPTAMLPCICGPTATYIC